MELLFTLPDPQAEVPIEPFFESEVLRFEIVPVMALFGQQYLSDDPTVILPNTDEMKKEIVLIKQGIVTKTTLRCFGYTNGPTRLFKKEIHRYVAGEAKKVKRNSRKRLMPSNIVSTAEYLQSLQYGALVLKHKYKSPRRFLAKIKSSVPASVTHELNFSNIARYVLNGVHDKMWYEDTYQDILRFFPEDDPRLISDFLAATSIRSSIEANVKKFLLAYYQHHNPQLYTVTLRIGNQNRTVQSYFKGFLDAVIIHLNYIHGGIHLCEADENDMDAARKIKNFSKAIMGDKWAIPVDIWLMRAFNTDIKYMYNGKMLSRSPTEKLYDAIHAYLALVAEATGFEPRQFSASVWSGIRGQTSASTTTRFGPLLQKALGTGLFGTLNLLPTG